MTLLGFDVVGRLALGQISQNQDANPAIAQAAGTGVARSVTPNVGGIIAQAVGVGIARAFGSPILTVTLAPAVGIGTVGALVGSDPQSLLGVSGIGTAGSFAISESAFLIGAVGIGVAGNVIAVSSAPTIVQAAGIGVAGQFFASISGFLNAAVGLGRAGSITVTLSGSGGARKKIRGGFEPIDKRPPEPVAFSASKVPLPPFRDAPALAPIDEPPPELVDRNLIPSDMLGLRDQIYTAQDISDIEKFLADHDQDQQDIDDIADVLALLD